jgi:hypothetical protein
MSIEKMREEFEAAVRKDFEEAGICEADLRKDESGQYLVDVHVAAWWAWQQAFPLAAVKVLEVWEREGVASLRADNTDLHATLQAAKGEIERLKGECEALRATSDLKALLPDLGDALEDLELHGRHSDQGYRKLKDWYRKVALAYRVIDGPMFGAEHGELVSQNTWLRSVIERYAQQHAPLEPIPDREGWSTRLPGYDLPALLRDAERYRWLRKSGQYDWDVNYGKLEFRIETPCDDASDLDGCIDAAMSKEASHG